MKVKMKSAYLKIEMKHIMYMVELRNVFEFMNLRVGHDLIQPYTNELNAPLADIRPLFAEESWSNWDYRIRPLLEDSKH